MKKYGRPSKKYSLTSKVVQLKIFKCSIGFVNLIKIFNKIKVSEFVIKELNAIPLMP
jgi:hypothetical protein